MRSPGVIYRRYRQLRRKLLYEKIVESREKKHENCIFGKKLKVEKDGEVRFVDVCLFKHMSDKDTVLDLCTCAKECNAFANKYTKESVEEEFNRIVSDHEQVKQAYPDLALFQWVLDKELTDARQKPPFWLLPVIFCIELLEEFVKFTGIHQKNMYRD